MIDPHIIIHGDPKAGVPYVGLAKKFARQTHKAKIANKTWRVAADVMIRVENYFSGNGGFSKVWIEAKASSGGYQFYTTSPNVMWATDQDPLHDFFPGGSAIFVPTPTISRNPDGSIKEVKFKAYPTGSTAEESATGRWKYFETSPYPTLDELNAIMQGTSIFKIKGGWQVNGVPEYRYDFIEDQTRPERPKITLINSWVQHGQVRNAGVLSTISPFAMLGDINYDLTTSPLKKQLTSLAPDTDWFGRSCVQKVGDRLFVIMDDAEGVWHCFPLKAPLDVSQYEDKYAEYADQAYKANVIPDYAKKATPVYPSWVSEFSSHRDAFKEDSEVRNTKHRYIWSFNSTGTRAICVLAQREDSLVKSSRIDYAMDAIQPPVNYPPYTNTHIPTEVAITKLQIDPSQVADMKSDPQDIKVDKRGIVELEFKIEVNGNKLEDFDFTIEILTQKSPDELSLLGKGEIVEIAYARNVRWDIAPGSLLTDDPAVSVSTDNILSVWIELYWMKMQRDLIRAYDGLPAILIPSKSKARFYKGIDFDNTILCVPLSQSHGKGFTYTDATGDPPPLPAEPHLFVYNPSSAFEHRYPWEPKDGNSNELYYYSATITHLDLSSLSFYYTTRLLEQKRSETTVFEPSPNGTAINDRTVAPIENRAKRWCAVVVKGKVLEHKEVGHEDLSMNWLQGWAREMGNADLDEDELYIDVDGVGNTASLNVLRATGFHAQGNWNSINPGFLPLLGRRIWTNVGTSYAIQLDELPNQPWWLVGVCGFVFYTVLASCLWYELYGESKTETSGLGDSSTIVVNAPTQISQLEENAVAFFSFLYDAWDTILYTTTGTISGTSYLTEWRFSKTETTTPSGTASDIRFNSSNPFSLGNSGLTKAQFVEEITDNSYIDSFLKFIKEFYAGAAIKSGFNYTDLQAYCPISFSTFPHGGGLLSGYNGKIPENHFNAFTELAGTGVDKYKHIRYKYLLRDYETHRYYYNKAINDHFSVNLMDQCGAILVTTDGRISYAKKDLWEIKKTVVTQKVRYMDHRMVNNSLDFTAPDTKSTVSLVVFDINDTPLTDDDVDWKSVERVYWDYGRVWSQHLSLYNLAYQNKVNDETPLKTFVAGGYLGQAEEVLTNKYQEEQFRPKFTFAEIDGMQFIHPNVAQSGIYNALINWSLPWFDMHHNEATSDPAIFDSRSERTFIRHSPLFF